MVVQDGGMFVSCCFHRSVLLSVEVVGFFLEITKVAKLIVNWPKCTIKKVYVGGPGASKVLRLQRKN